MVAVADRWCASKAGGSAGLCGPRCELPVIHRPHRARGVLRQGNRMAGPNGRSFGLHGAAHRKGESCASSDRRRSCAATALVFSILEGNHRGVGLSWAGSAA